MLYLHTNRLSPDCLTKWSCTEELYAPLRPLQSRQYGGAVNAAVTPGELGEVAVGDDLSLSAGYIYEEPRQLPRIPPERHV